MSIAYVRDQLLAEVLDSNPGGPVTFDEYSTLRRLGTTRAVLRGALASLAEAGVLVRAPRTGTSLAQEPYHFELTTAGPLPGSSKTPIRYETTDIQRAVPSEAISTELTGRAGSLLTRLSRSSVINGRASEHWTIWTNLEIPEEALARGLPVHLNWYEYVKSLTGQGSFTMSRRTVNYRATEHDRDLLDVEVGDPLRFASRHLSTVDGVPIDRSWGRINSQVVVSSEVFTITV